MTGYKCKEEGGVKDDAQISIYLRNAKWTDHGATEVGNPGGAASLGRKVVDELCFGQDKFQDKEVSRNQSECIGLKLTVVRPRDTDLRVLSIDGNEYSVRTAKD